MGTDLLDGECCSTSTSPLGALTITANRCTIGTIPTRPLPTPTSRVLAQVRTARCMGREMRMGLRLTVTVCTAALNRRSKRDV